MIFVRFLVLISLFSSAACTQLPELDGIVEPHIETAPYPDLLPLEPILAAASGSSLDPVREQNNLQARLAMLRARADRLRGSVLNGPEKQRLERGLG